jgi:glycosyltransferase involved in cell wall biosynthesis
MTSPGNPSPGKHSPGKTSPGMTSPGKASPGKTFTPPREIPDRALATSRPSLRPEDLRVVFLSDAVPARNGVGTYYDDLADHLRDRLGGVMLLTPPADESEPFVGWTTPMPGDPTQRIYFPSPRMYWRRIRDFDPHVIVSATPGGYGLLGLLLAAAFRTALAVGYHTEYSELAGLYWAGPKGKAYKGAMALWDRMMVRFGSSVLVPNALLRDTALSWGARDVRIMGTPVQKRFLDEPTSPLPRRIRTVSYVGRLAPEKELDQIRRAAGRLPSMHFRLAGDGPLRSEVEAWSRTHPNLEYVGWIPRERVLDLLDQTDLFVLPSRFETFGTAAFEAMVRRRLVLVSPHCGIVQFPDLTPGLLQMRHGENLADAAQRALSLGAEVHQRVAGAGAEAARHACRRTIDEWVEVLVTTVHESRFA